MQKQQEKPIWESDCYGMLNCVDNFFAKHHRLLLDSEILNGADAAVVLQYDLPSYLFKRKRYNFFLRFTFKDACKSGEGIDVKLLNKRSQNVFFVGKFYNDTGVESFLTTNIVPFLGVSTEQTPIVEELFKLNEKFDRLLGIIEKSAKSDLCKGSTC